jgi:hypothetical protein
MPRSSHCRASKKAMSPERSTSRPIAPRGRLGAGIEVVVEVVVVVEGYGYG